MMMMSSGICAILLCHVYVNIALFNLQGFFFNQLATEYEEEYI